MSPPAFYASDAHLFEQWHFRCLVSLGAYSGHDVRSLVIREDVHGIPFQMQDLDLTEAEDEEYLTTPEKEECLLKHPDFFVSVVDGVCVCGTQHPHPELFWGL